MTNSISRGMIWLDSVRGNDSIREMARKVGVSHATLTRQARDNTFTFEMVRDISRTYRRPVIQDVLAFDFLSPDDVGSDGVERVLRTASEELLVLEVGRRLGVASIFDLPIGEAIASADVTDISNRRGASDVGGSTDAEVRDALPISRKAVSVGKRAAKKKSPEGDQ